MFYIYIYIYGNSLKSFQAEVFTEEFMCKGCSLVLETVNYYACVSFTTQDGFYSDVCHHCLTSLILSIESVSAVLLIAIDMVPVFPGVFSVF